MSTPAGNSSRLPVAIRAYEADDWEEVAELFQCPRCVYGTLRMPYQSRDEIRKFLENAPSRLHRLVAYAPDLHRLVGMLGLHHHERRRAHVGEIGMFVHDDHHNRGVGGALLRAAIDFAEKYLYVTRLELYVYVDNALAIHLYQKHGFEVEGTLRKYALRAGELIDAHVMGRLGPQRGA